MIFLTLSLKSNIKHSLNKTCILMCFNDLRRNVTPCKHYIFKHLDILKYIRIHFLYLKKKNIGLQKVD